MTNANVTVTEITAYEALRLAQIGFAVPIKGCMVSSAKLCLDEAEAQFNAGRFAAALNRAAECLRYTRGIFDASCNLVVAVRDGRASFLRA